MTAPNLVHVDVCSGVGMNAIAARAAGFTTRTFCEIEPYCRHVLGYYWPEVPCHDDLRTLAADRLREWGVGRVDLLSGGVPCQPSSGAGKRLGSADPRWLWPDFLRLVGEVQPTWVVAENPAIPGLLTVESGRAFEGILSALEQMGYRVGWTTYAASDVGAPHERLRVFVVAHTDRGRELQPSGPVPHVGRRSGNSSGAVANANGKPAGTGRPGRPETGQETGVVRGTGVWGSALADPQRTGREGQARQGDTGTGRASSLTASRHRGDRRTTLADAGGGRGQDHELRSGRDIIGVCGAGGSGEREAPGGKTPRLAPGVGGLLDGATRLVVDPMWPAGRGPHQHAWEPARTAVGIIGRGNQLKALGNGCVPQQIYPVFKAIADQSRREQVAV